MTVLWPTKFVRDTESILYRDEEGNLVKRKLTQEELDELGIKKEPKTPYELRYMGGEYRLTRRGE